VLDVYSLRHGDFEIVDLDIIDERTKKVRIFRLIRFGIIISVIIFLFAILFALGSDVSYAWVIILLPVLLAIVLIPSYFKAKSILPEQVMGLLLGFNINNEPEKMRVQKWQIGSINEFVEEEVRYNQAIGFKAIWKDNGEIIIEIVVDPNYPGMTVFETLTFHTLAEFIVTMQMCMPDHDKWYYQLEDNSDWPLSAKNDINQEILTARVPWQIRDYFESP
jgi:hypothetical protein